MAPGTPVHVLVLIVMIFVGYSTPIYNGLLTSQRVTAVKLHGGHMEIVEEEKCSKGVLRLTCRSLRASLLVLEATYQTNRTNRCAGYKGERHKGLAKNRGHGNELLSIFEPRKTAATFHAKMVREIRGNYVKDSRNEEEMTDVVDIRLPINRRCSGLQHCRFNLNFDHPEAAFWSPANLRLKYACIPEAAVRKYCNMRLSVVEGEGGYLKSPGYPLYYRGGSSCGWTFESQPGQRISLTFHDLNMRSPEQDGSCVDVLRVRDHGVTLFESCGTAAGVQVLSQSNLLTLDLIALGNLYPSRGFLLQYRAVGCSDVDAPKGSYVVNETNSAKTFLCKMGTVFPDTKMRTKLIKCRNGIWSEDIERISGQSCVETSALIKPERGSAGGRKYASLAEEPGMGDGGFFPAGGVIRRSNDAIAMPPLGSTMDPARDEATMKGDYFVDYVVPSVLIALLFIGNAVIVYVIFQYRKRKQPALGGEEIALRDPEGVPQV